MVSDPIETAPKNEEWIALLGESGDVFEIARWSVEKGNWVGREGEPIRIKPTHWFRPDPSWLSTTYTSPQGKKTPRRKRFGLYAGLLIIACSATLEVPRFVGPPPRENSGKSFSTDASVAPQTVASEHVAGAEMANLYVRTAAESPAGIENTYAQESAKPSSNKPKQGPEQFHLRADAIGGDPVHAREQLEAVTGQVTQATPADDAAAIGQERTLRHERRRIDALARDLGALREEIEAIETRLAAARAARAMLTEELEVAAPDDISAAVPLVRTIDREPIALFVRRGDEFIAAGDFVGARVVFRHAAELGDARAARTLAATYDPNPLQRFRVNGVTADFAKAPFWYETAMLSALPSRREGSNLWPAGQWPKVEGFDGS